MSSLPMRGLFSLLITLFVGSSVVAQPLFKIEHSLELAVANSPRIYVATIDAIEPAVKLGAPQMLHLKVKETIKGHHRQKHAVLLNHLTDAQQLAQDSGTPVLVLEIDNTHKALVIPLTEEPSPKALTTKFDVIRDSTKLLEMTKELAQETIGIARQRSVRVRVPQAFVKDTHWMKYYRTGGGVSLHVPVDKQLEQHAKTWLRDYPDHSIIGGEAIEALRYFKTDENIALVRSYFDHDEDDETAEDTDHQPGGRSFNATDYAARRTLRYWGVPSEAEEDSENADKAEK